MLDRTGALEPADEVLVARYRAGDAEGFEALVRRYERPVYLFCLRLSGDRSAAADATQEVFLRAYRAMSRWNGQASFRTWLFTIARNHCVDQRRKARHRKTESLSQTSDDTTVGPPEPRATDAGSSPDRAATNASLARAIYEALARLPDVQREVFVLREHGGCSYKEIADITGVAENTVKSRMRYALERLREELERAGFRGMDGHDP
ncbi:MAG: RNA polymerase sigma factor [Myxococcales bacterium]|nr:RNA polymerase sigma factor [Myxococcales bacterium]